MSRDIVLVTVDALRHDVAGRMDRTRRHFEAATETTAITPGAATNWVFPGILSGTYYPNAYGEDGLLRDDLVSLPDVLGEAGYDTGAVLGFNPYLSKWEGRFDAFWNGGIDDTDERWHSNRIEKWLSRGYRTALLKKRVSGAEVVRRAREWYEGASSPRFLWVHLMEPHKPYYPGLATGLDVGLFDTYRSIVNLQRHGDGAPQRDIDVQRTLYERCVERADARVDGVLSFADDDAATVVVGDHGEEFDHGHLGHERLYDECVKVPLFHRNLVASPSGPARQIDIPAEILSTAGHAVPDGWDAEGFGTETPAFMLTPRSANGTFQYAIRTDSAKLIRTYDADSGEVRDREYYDLDADPAEREDRYRSADTGSLEAQLDAFVDEYDHALDIDPETGIDSSAVDERLRNLGYR